MYLNLNNKKFWQIGELKERVINLLGLNITIRPIYIGNDNILHMQTEHPIDYSNYGSDIAIILNNPTYVSKHPDCGDGAIHYIRVYNPGNIYVKLVVRPTKKEVLFVRSLFIISRRNIHQYWTSHSLKSY